MNAKFMHELLRLALCLANAVAYGSLLAWLATS